MMRLGVYALVLGMAVPLITGCGSATREAVAAPGDPAPDSLYNFELEVEGEIVGAFRGVDGLNSEIEVIEFRDGVDEPVRKRPGRTTYANITLKKGYLAPSGLRAWWEQTLRGEFVHKDCVLTVFDSSGTPVDTYNLFNAWPCKWKGFSLDAKSGNVGDEEIELTIEGLERVQPPPPPEPGHKERPSRQRGG